MKITRAKTLPIGVDLGTDAAKAAQLGLAGDELELLAAGAVKMPNATRKDPARRLEFLSVELRKLLRSGGFKGTACVLSMPAEATFVHPVRIPKVPPAEVGAAVQAELGGKLPYAVEEAVVRHVVAGETFGEGQTRREVLTVSVPRSTVEAYLDMARRARLDVVGINVEPCAVVECFARLFRRSSDRGRVILYVDIGCASTQVVLAHGPCIVFARNLAFGAERFDRAVARHRGVTIEQAAALRRELQGDQAGSDDLRPCLEGRIGELAEEITQCLRYCEVVFHHQEVERAIFVGGQAHDKWLCQAIARRLNVPAQIGDPLTRVKWACRAQPEGALDRRKPQPQWAVAVGLSLGAATAA